MLHQLRTLQELQRISNELAFERGFDITIITKAWLALGANQAFFYKVQQSLDSLYLSRWIAGLSDIIPIAPLCDPLEYEIIGIDGSQIYPDRHYALSCFLINIGSTHVKYVKSGASMIMFDSIPHVFSHITFDNGCYDVSRTVVNCVRQELEFTYALALQRKTNSQAICFMDGSLIFWHLLSQPDYIKDRFLQLYIDLLHGFHAQNMPIIGYISMPKSKDLISLLRFAIDEKILTDIGNIEEKQWEKLVDATIMRVLLPKYHRTTLFHYYGVLKKTYPTMSCPYFFYINTGSEIARIELPAWVAQNASLVEHLAAVLIDQCIKGNGYPVVLAESHEQAVVKGVDRDWFYQMLTTMLTQSGMNTSSISCKSEKKLRMNI